MPGQDGTGMTGIPKVGRWFETNDLQNWQQERHLTGRAVRRFKANLQGGGFRMFDAGASDVVFFADQIRQSFR